MVVLAVVVLVLLALGAAVAVRRVRAEREAARRELEAAHATATEERARREELEERAQRADQRALTERGARAHADRAARMEREWTRELRSQVAALHRRAGTLGEGSPRELVLRLAMELLDAEKGLLLERSDADGDGLLDLVCARGFEHDPEGSALVQSLARRSLRADETLREDDAGARAGQEGRTAADEELACLVALPVVLADELHGILVCANRPGGFEELDDDVLLALGDHAGAVLENGRLRGDLRSALLATVRVLAAAIETRDPPLRGHGDDVARLVGAVAERLEVPQDRREALMVGSLLHDVGKLAVPETILGKPGPLDDAERALVERHPDVGRRLIEHVPALRVVGPAIGHHHERFDGTGYPSGLAGEDIPLEARIIGVADAYSAMVADRPYRDGLPPAVAREELTRGAGSHFDPEVVRTFLAALDAQDGFGGPGGPADDTDLRDALATGVSDVGAAPPLDLSVLDATDPVTLLRSHRHLHEAAAVQAERAAAGGAPFAIVAVHVRDLHERNRATSFADGDAHLRAVAAVLEDLAAAWPGAVAGRLGGATLAVLVPGAPDGIGDELARRVGPVGEVAVAEVRWVPGEAGHTTVDRAADAAGVAQPTG